MANESKRRHPSIPNLTTATTEQQSLTSNTHHEKGERKLRGCETLSNSDDSVTGIHSRIKGDKKQTKRDIYDIASHRQSTLDLRPDGSIMITPHLGQLPNEIVTLILNHLSEQRNTLYECALATKQFHAIANSLLWRVLDFDQQDISDRCFYCLSDASTQRLATLGQHMCDLGLRSHHWTDAHLVRLLPHIPHLQRLSVLSTRLTNKSFQQLFHQCPHLTCLRLDRADLTQASFSAIGQHCHQLDHLDWRLTTGQSAEWLAMLLPCPLKRLKLAVDTSLTEKSMTIIKSFPDLACLHIAHQGPNAMNFLLQPTPTNITHSNNNNKNNNGHGSLETHGATHPLWPQLTSFTLAVCNDIDEPTLVHFIKCHPHLQDIHLVESDRLTDRSLDAMAAWLPDLAHVTLVNLGNITSDGLRRFLVQHCARHLALVKVFFCDHVLIHDFPESMAVADWGIELDRHRIEMTKQAEQERHQLATIN